MAETNTTILIPDISGFTEFMTNTELNHSSMAINMLIEAIVKPIEEEYEVSEIEGDAVLLIKKGAAPSQKEVLDTCLKIFNSFHSHRIWIQQHAVCPCGACVALANLSLKFVVHHGPLAEIKVGRFVKQSGTEMIIAHRLLKNKIDSNEYLLMTEKMLQGAQQEDVELNWVTASEEYNAIGKVDYRYTLLNEVRERLPQPPAPQDYRRDDTPYTEMTIPVHFRDAYMMLMNIPGRADWVPGLLKVEQDIPQVFIGNSHRLTFEDFSAVVTPVRMSLLNDALIYAENCRIDEHNLTLVYEFIFKKEPGDTCLFSFRVMNADDSLTDDEFVATLQEQLEQTAEVLKEQCSKMETSLFEACAAPVAG